MGMRLQDNEVCFVLETPLGERFFLSRNELVIEEGIVDIDVKDLMLVSSVDPTTQKTVSGLTKIMASRNYNRMTIDIAGSIIGTVLKDSEIGKAVVGARSGIVV